MFSAISEFAMVYIDKTLPREWQERIYPTQSIPWASGYQIRKITGCTYAGNAGNVYPATDFKGNPLVSDPSMHHGTCVISGKRPMAGDDLTKSQSISIHGIDLVLPEYSVLNTESVNITSRCWWNLFIFSLPSISSFCKFCPAIDTNTIQKYSKDENDFTLPSWCVSSLGPLSVKPGRISAKEIKLCNSIVHFSGLDCAHPQKGNGTWSCGQIQ